VLKKFFWGDDQNFSGLLMRFARGDMRDHIVSHKNDHGASYKRYGVLQWRSRLKISFCEIFGVVRFSTFATKSVLFGHRSDDGGWRAEGEGEMNELEPDAQQQWVWFGAALLTIIAFVVSLPR
jgi:hypothetical protein